MKHFVSSSLVAATLAVSSITAVQAATVLDLTAGNGGSPTLYGGALWETAEDVDVPTGTGVFKPFLRLQNSPSEQGYNTDRKNADQQFDEKAGTWTRSILLSSLAIIDGFYRFALDLGEPATDTSKISVQQFKLFTASDSNLNGASFDLGTGLFTDPSVVLRFDLDADEDRRVDLDYNLIGSGNGRQDLFISVSALLFSAAGAGDYLVLYSQLGTNCEKERGVETCEAGFGSHGTFEEFSVRPAGDLPPPPPPPPVPLPAAGWLMLAGLGGLAAMRRRKRA